MNKKEWISQQKILKEHLKTAEKNAKTAGDQIDELELTILAYDDQIATFK